MIKVFIVDDHPLVRQGLKAFLATQGGIEIVGEAGDGEAAWEGIRKTEPDVAVIDLHLPGWSGIQLIRTIKAANIPTRVIVLSSFCEDGEVIAAIEAGALSYLMKDSPPEKLAAAIVPRHNLYHFLSLILCFFFSSSVTESGSISNFTFGLNFCN
ncbi:MAG: response regulator transcription factor [Firmicutes bacterium]|nr:response regulator transcription factor [Bacillota bacterium]